MSRRAHRERYDIDRVTMRAVSPLADFSFDYQDLAELRPAAAH